MSFLHNNSMPNFFPDEQARQATMEANCMDDKKAVRMLLACRYNFFGKIGSIFSNLFILLFVVMFINSIGLVENYLPDYQELVSQVASFGMKAAPVCLLLYMGCTLFYHFAAVIAWRRCRDDESPRHIPYTVTDGSFISYKVTDKRSSRTDRILTSVKVTYRDEFGRVRKAWSDEQNLYFLRNMSKGEALKIATVRSLGSSYSKAFIAAFFQDAASL